NSQPFILPFATTSTFKDILSQETNSKVNAMLRLSNGNSFVLHNLGQSKPNRDQFAFVRHHQFPFC
ncbi:MAG: hypothetical protein RH946_19995, partial [Rhodospirillales bacterium]